MTVFNGSKYQQKTAFHLSSQLKNVHSVVSWFHRKISPGLADR